MSLTPEILSAIDTAVAARMSPPRESYYTTKSAAALLLVHPDTIARLIASGALRSVGAGRLKRIAQSAINEYLAGSAS